MRKILLATTALVGFAVAGAAQAATSPLTVTVGGSVDFVAGAMHESMASGALKPSSGDFETIYSLDFGIAGKAANGIEYGGQLVLDNDTDGFGQTAVGTPDTNGIGNTIAASKAIVFMSGAFGKVQLGDARGATDLSVEAPAVVTNRYVDFLNSGSYAKKLVLGVDVKDHSTNVTYYTPKVGNANHKVQLGVTYTPQFDSYGSTVTLEQTAGYKNMVKGALAYNGNFKSVAVKASTNLITAESDSPATNLANQRPFISWGIGAQAAYSGFTLGGSYKDMGHFNTITGQDKNQHVYAAALKYEINKIGVGVNYLGGAGYDNALNGSGTSDHVKDFNNYGLGGSYAWAPGLTTNVDGVLFGQKTEAGTKNDGYVLLLSQKLAF
ncbi:MAG: porin [Alphaproteobacteria bacterium]|nr:porin [Alphaproteobacteria bacterium]